MSAVSPIKTNWTAGEVSPKLKGRVDVVKHENGAETVRNFLVTPFGGVNRRPGTVFVAGVRTHNQAAIIIPFVFSTDQTYQLVFNADRIRFFRNQAPIVETAVAISGGITQANPGVVTAASHGYSNGDDVIITGVVGMTEVNGKTYRVANATANTFALTDPANGNNVDTSGYTAYASGGSVKRIYEIASPYAEEDLDRVQWAQIADIMYLAHPDYAPRKLSRTGHTAWTLSTVTFINGPYKPRDESTRTMTPGATSGATTMTASTAFFTADMVGMLIRYGTGGGYALITGYTSTTVVNITVQKTLSGTGASTDWEIGAWGEEYGYPACVTFYEQRSSWAATYAQPQTTWLSVSEDYENMLAGANDADALLFTIATEEVNAIRWLKADKPLILGTSGGPFSLSSGSNADPLTPTNVVVKKENGFGCYDILPEKIGNYVYYVQRDGKIIRELAFDFNIDAFKALNISLISEHITGTGIVDMAYQQSPDNVLWLVRADGKICTLTREVDQEVAAWAQHDTREGSDLFESISVIPGTSYDEVWVIVKRTINGYTRRYVEYFAGSDFTDQEDAHYVDSGLKYDGAPATTISGADHLEGMEAAIFADGAVVPNQTVTNGTITLENAASVVIVGIPITSRVKLLTIEGGSATGSSQAKQRRIVEAIVRVYRSLGFTCGLDESSLDDVEVRNSDDPMDEPPTLASDDFPVLIPGGWNKKSQLVVEVSQPVPLHILAIMFRSEVED